MAVEGFAGGVPQSDSVAAAGEVSTAVGRPGHREHLPGGGANAIAICDVDARCLVVSCNSGAEVRCAQPLSGDSEGYLFEAADDDRPLWALAAGHVDDRAVLVAGGASGLMTVWDAATGKVIETNLRGHHEHIYALVMDESGRIVSSGEDGTLIWWDSVR
ncbi:WD40 repeat domain-containing protein [Saccharothrix stipae]